jgi:hypothetical protein
MSQSNDDTMVVLLPGYSSVTATVGAFEAVRAVCDERDAGGAAQDHGVVIHAPRVHKGEEFGIGGA